MKKSLFLILLLNPMITFGQENYPIPNFQEIIVEQNKTATSKSSVVNYFPLITGDFWEYIESEGLLSSQTKEVLGDTLLPNGKIYKKVYAQYCANSVDPMPELELLRKDSTGNVYSFLDGRDYLLYDFTKNTLDTMSAPWPGYYWKIRNKYNVIAFGEDTVKAIDMALYDSLNRQSFFITFVEQYGITYYNGERNRQAGDYVSAKYWASIIDGFQRKELIVSQSKPDWKAYYPLEVGDKWIYHRTNLSLLEGTVEVEVLKDTLFEDGFTYKKLYHVTDWGGTFEPEEWVYYERLDSLGRVFRKEPYADYGDRPVIQFAMCVGDTIALYKNVNEYRMLREKLNYFWDILNDYEYTLFYSDPYSVASEDQYFVKNIGLIKKGHEGISDNLVGAYINGVVYGDTTITSIRNENVIPGHINLSQNYPNPFNGITKIKFNLDKQQKVTLIVYDLTGKEIKRLINKQGSAMGGHEVVWNGKNNDGEEVASGIYLYTLILGNTTVQTKKLIYLK